MNKFVLAFALLCLSWSNIQEVCAAKLRVAVASNFAITLKALAAEFEYQTDHQVVISSGSSGKQFAQIVYGAPYDIFFSADTERPQKLIDQGIGIADSLSTYALGKLVLWNPKVNSGAEALRQLRKSDQRIAIANPRLAPYGSAAQQVLDLLGLTEKASARLITGENIAQTFQFVDSFNAPMGFVAASQFLTKQRLMQTGVWIVPSSYYSPIKQQAVLIKDSSVAREFLDFVLSDSGRQIIAESGYDLP